jgi:malignant T-cell-amplified sequence
LKRHFASKHDSREYIERVQQSSGLKLQLERSAQVELIQPDSDVTFLVVDGRYTFVEVDGSIIPFVGSKELTSLLPSVYVDEGAVRFILKGADVMRPGIARYDEWGEKGSLIVIRDEAKQRAIALGRTSVASSEMPGMSRGASIQNLHYAGDRVWISYKKI